MLYLLATATAAMTGTIFWMAAYRMRPERVRSERERTRGKHAFRPKERAKFLLSRSFAVPPDTPDWADPLVTQIGDVPAPLASEPAATRAD